MIQSYIADPHQRRMLKKWGAILESGKPIQNESTKVMLAQLLENTRNFYKMQGMLNEAGIYNESVGVTQGDVVNKGTTRHPGTDGLGYMQGTNSYPYRPGSYGDNYLPSVVFPMLRRIMPDLIANDLVGVQPLNGPVGYAMAYRPIYNGKGTVGHGNGEYNDQYAEIGYAPTDTRYSGSLPRNADGQVLTSDSDLTALHTHTADFGLTANAGNTEFWDAYAGNSKGQWDGEGAPLNADSEFADLHDGGYATVSFGLVKSAVEAKTRKLAAHWSPELAEDMQAMHGIDVEKEMLNTLTYEVGAEIDRQIITEMVKAAITGGSVSKWTPLSADGLDQMGRLATLLTQITIEAQQIALRTRRGCANFVVTTPRVCALLQQMSMNKFTSFKNTDAIPSVPDSGVGALAKVGLINDDQQLLVRDAYASTGKYDYVLMGYKGKQAGDSGIIYCPYIPLQLSKVMQPGSFTPSIGARTRYGIMSNPWDAKNFYHFMKIETCGTYTWTDKRQFIATPSPVNLVNNPPKQVEANQTTFPQPE